MSAQIARMRFGRLHQDRHLGRRLAQPIPVLVGQALRQLGIGLLDGLLVDVQVHQARLEMQLLRRPVADRVVQAVAAHVAAFVGVGAEGVEGVLVGAVDRRAGQAEQERVRQRVAHLAAQIAFLRAVRLVHQHDDVVAVVQHAVGLGELVDRGDHHLPRVLAQQIGEFLAAFRAHHVGHVGGIEGAGDLAVEVDPVHHDQHRGVLQRRVQPQLARGEQHQQRFARPLEMPDQPLARLARHDPRDDLVDAVHLLIAGDDLDAVLALLRGERGEAVEHVEHHRRAQHRRGGLFHLAQRLLAVAVAPGAPQIDRHPDRAVAELLALGRHRKDVGHEQFRHVLLVIVMDLDGGVEPALAGPHRRLGLDQRPAECR